MLTTRALHAFDIDNALLRKNLAKFDDYHPSDVLFGDFSVKTSIRVIK